jgi:hypothetical protein
VDYRDLAEDAATRLSLMIERRTDWKRAEQSDARFLPTISPSAAGERRLIRPLPIPSDNDPQYG